MSEHATPLILVVDDEPHIAEVIVMALQNSGFDTVVAENGTQALLVASDRLPDMVILDVMLPDINGFEVAKRIGMRSQRMPILFLTALDNMSDKIHGLTIGGDDYMTKPFSVEELLARVQVILRRQGLDASQQVLTFENLELNDIEHLVRNNGQIIDLTATEYRLLRFFMLNPNKALTRLELLEHVRQYDFGGDARVLETYISYLRKKIDVAGQSSLIHTVRSVGYALRSSS